jgi:isoquinoline 1-oxidoreductase beta subunit
MNRRGFLLACGGIGGTLLVGWAITPPPPRLELDNGHLALGKGEVQLNGWLKISAPNEVTIVVPRSEMGQGVYTALPMLLAEELCADFSKVIVEQSPIDQMYANVALLQDALPIHPDAHGPVREALEWIVAKVARQMSPMMTGGSSSVKDAWHPMRSAGAAAREMLLAAAAARFKAPVAECTARAGWVTHASGLKASFGELAADAARLTPPRVPRLKEPGEFTLIGKPVARTDIPAKVTGEAQFGLDVRLPDMLFASIRMAPNFGGSFDKWRTGIAEKMPGVKAVLPVDTDLAGAAHGVAVVAEQWWQAESALKELEPHITWNPGPHGTLDSATIYAQLKSALDSGHADVFHSSGKLAEGFAQAARTLEAEYRVPYLAHATMEPQNCTALVRNGKVDIWGGTQSPSLARWIAAQAADVKEQDVTVHTTFLGGGFGRRIELDVVAQAVTLARQVPGRPVQLIWPREQDTQHDVYRPASICRFRAGLDSQGNITAWHHKMACGSIVDSLCGRMGLVFMGGGTLPQRLTHWMGKAGTPDKSNAEGASDVPYEFTNQRVEAASVHQPVPLGFWRSVGHSQNAFNVEAFLDEVAAAANKDPLQLRRELLKKHPRALAVLNLAAEKAGWGQPLPAGRARGVALHLSFGSLVAEVAEVSIVKDGQGSRPRVHRVTCAIDCGLPVNPEIIRQQVESGVIFGLTAALYGEISLKDGRVAQANFNTYDMLRMAETPQIEVHIVPSAEVPAGVGEPATPPIAPAVCNAIFALTRQPVRSLPIRL